MAPCSLVDNHEGFEEWTASVFKVEVGHTRNIEAACSSTIYQIIWRHILEHSCIRFVSFMFALLARATYAGFYLTCNVERSCTVSEKV